jgi:hypothetical protein
MTGEPKVAEMIKSASPRPDQLSKFDMPYFLDQGALEETLVAKLALGRQTMTTGRYPLSR